MNHLNFDYIRSVGRNIRLHGNGFIQIDTGPRQRLHVFGHPDAPRQKVPTPIHDHKFSFKSRIYSGALINAVWHFDARLPHTHFVCGYEPSGKGGEDTRLIETDERGGLRLASMMIHTPGDQYRHSHGILHETFANEPTITVMDKTGFDETHKPRVLCRIGLEPDNYFTRYDLDDDELWRMVADALRWSNAHV